MRCDFGGTATISRGFCCGLPRTPISYNCSPFSCTFSRSIGPISQTRRPKDEWGLERTFAPSCPPPHSRTGLRSTGATIYVDPLNIQDIFFHHRLDAGGLLRGHRCCCAHRARDRNTGGLRSNGPQSISWYPRLVGCGLEMKCEGLGLFGGGCEP